MRRSGRGAWATKAAQSARESVAESAQESTPEVAEGTESAEASPCDRELVEQVCGGRTSAYATLVRRHQEVLYRHARGMGLDHDVTEDLVQEAFVRAWRKLDGCRDPDRFGLWVFRIFRHQCLDHVKDIRRRHVPLEDTTLPAERGDPERDREAAELRERMRCALDRLTPDLREAFLMKHHEGRSYQEMAELTEASVSALKMRVHRAREELQAALTRH